jgi:hypothetical protein
VVRSFICAILSLPVAAFGNIVVNGDFENPATYTNHGSWVGDSYWPNWEFPGWLIGGVGGIDLMRSFPAASGAQCVNLNGTTWGRLDQYLSTSQGTDYQLRFALSWNPGGAEAQEQVWVSFGESWGQYIYYPKGPTPIWTYYTFNIPAQASTSRLTFESAVSGYYGPMIDDVSVVAVPEPACLAMLAVGLTALVNSRRRAAGR